MATTSSLTLELLVNDLYDLFDSRLPLEIKVQIYNSIYL